MKTLSQSKDTQMLQLPLLPKFQSVDGAFMVARHSPRARASVLLTSVGVLSCATSALMHPPGPLSSPNLPEPGLLFPGPSSNNHT